MFASDLCGKMAVYTSGSCGRATYDGMCSGPMVDEADIV
jgi:hypothetical protein